MWSGPYRDLYFHSVCVCKLWILPLSWFVYERMRLRPRPHVSVFNWKRNFFFTHTATVHMYLMKPIKENGTFRKRSLEWKFLKALFSRVCVDRRNRNSSKTLRSQYQFQSTPRNIRNLFEMADGRFPSSGMPSRLSYRFKSINQIRVEGRKRCESATSAREFFWKRKKKVAFSNEYGNVWQGLYLINARVLKIERSLYVKMLYSASLGLDWKECNLFKRSFCSVRFWKYAMKLCIIQCYP